MRRFLFGLLASCGILAIGVPALTDWPWWSGVLIFLPAHLCLLWAQLSPLSPWLGPVVTKFLSSPDRREIWLTIDDGPDPEETPRVLDLLDRFGAKATFFVIGTKASQFPELIQAIHQRGHHVANHTETHPQAWFWMLPRSFLTKELDSGSAAIREILGPSEMVSHFRSPVGMTPIALHPLLRERHWRLIGWTVRGRDGVRHPNLDRVLSRLMAGAAPGSILVLHEGRGHAPALLERLLPKLQAAELDCVIPSPDSFD